MTTVKITVNLKKGVADPEGSNTKKALGLLGFSAVTSVATSKTYKIEIDESDSEKAKATAKEMCEKLLANPVIQTYTIEVL